VRSYREADSVDIGFSTAPLADASHHWSTCFHSSTQERTDWGSVKLEYFMEVKNR